METAVSWTSFQSTPHPTPAFQSDFSKGTSGTRHSHHGWCKSSIIRDALIPKRNFSRRWILEHFLPVFSSRYVRRQLWMCNLWGAPSFFIDNSLKIWHFQIQQMKAGVKVGTRGWWSSPHSGTACRKSPRCWPGSARLWGPWPSWGTPQGRAAKASPRRSSWRWGKRRLGPGISDEEHQYCVNNSRSVGCVAVAELLSVVRKFLWRGFHSVQNYTHWTKYRNNLCIYIILTTATFRCQKSREICKYMLW